MARTVEQFSQFETELNRCLSVLDAGKQVVAYASSLVLAAEDLVYAVSTLGEAAEKTIQEDPRAEHEDTQMAYVLIYEWLDNSKNFMILWRDCIFALHNGEVKEQEGRVAPGTTKKLLRQINERLLGAASEWHDFGLRRTQEIQEMRKRDRKRLLEQWRLQKSPLETYQEQLKQIPEQCDRIQEQHLDLYPIAHQFTEIRLHLLEKLDRFWSQCLDVGSVVRDANEVCTELLKKDPEKNLGRVAAKLEDFDEDLDFETSLPDLEDYLNQQVRSFPEKMQVPVQVDRGLVLLQEVQFRRKARAWLESEVVPLLFQIQVDLENSRNEARMTLLNLRNWSLLLAREHKEGNGRPVHPDEFSQLPNELTQRLNTSAESIESLVNMIRERLDHEFRLSAVYRHNQEFLPLATQSTLQQLRGGEDSIVNRTGRTIAAGFREAWKFMANQVVNFQNFLQLVEKEETLSDSEKIVRFLEERQSDPRNGQYESIFRAQGFISTSFIVGREGEMTHAEKVLDSWENGYRGSLLLTGKRFCGKTLFGERLAEKYFAPHILRLEPNSFFTVQGRKYETTYDLGHALELIRKYTLNYKTLIWIDDFEHWWSPEFNYYQNGRAIKDFLEHQSGQTFLMVSMGNGLRPRLDKLVDWNRLFQAHINLDHMTSPEVHRAIELRHNATHQRLVDELGNDLNPKAFRRFTRAVYQAAGGNIGEALTEWAFSTRRRGDNTVENIFQYGHTLPDFLDEDLAVLLGSIMMQRRTSEFRLRQFFGPVFTHKYSLLVRRMLNVGVLVRGGDDWLEINPILANELGILLERNGYIRYSG